MSDTLPERLLPLHPAFEQKVVHILVRWLLIILAFHFVAGRGAAAEFPVSTALSYAFIASNLLLTLVPRRLFAPGIFVRALMAADFAFLALSIYFAREPQTQYHWVYIALLALLAWRSSLRLALWALVPGLLLASVLSFATTGRWQFSHDTGEFLRPTILFAVALFYFLVIDLIHRNARLFHIIERAKHEWERTADAMLDFILLVDEQGRIQRVNHALAARLGRHPRELVGRHWHDLLETAPPEKDESPLARMFRERTPVEGRHLHSALGVELPAIAVPLFEGDTVAGGLYVLRVPR